MTKEPTEAKPSSAKDNFFNALGILMSKNAFISSPRGEEAREVLGFKAVFAPYQRFCSFPARKFKLNYLKEEALWYFKADPCDVSICEHASIWQGLVNADGSINSNYGAHIFNGPHKGFGTQFDRAVETLVQDPDSRRAVVMILNKLHILSHTKDVPCTLGIQFVIRPYNGKPSLWAFSIMRSQDIIFGAGNDIPTFSFFQEILLTKLRGSDQKFSDLQMGPLVHTVSSLHIYQRHYAMAEKILKEGIKAYQEITVPFMTFKDAELLPRWTRLEKDGSTPFINWLLDRDVPNDAT